MISITPAAAAHLRSLLHASGGSAEPGTPDPVEKGLRILVEKGGCAGMQYSMKLDLPQEGDVFAESEGARVLMDPGSASLLRGSLLDYCDDLVGTGFRLQNPNAARSCGCGTSFEPAQAETGEAAGLAV